MRGLIGLFLMFGGFIGAATAAEVLLIDDGETTTHGWQARPDGKIATLDIRTTFNQRQRGDGCVAVTYNKPKGGWCSIGRAINADWTIFTCLRFWVRMVDVRELEVRLTDGGKENFIAKVVATGDGQWQHVVLPFAGFERNKGYQAMGASEDGKLDLDKIADLSISPSGEGAGRLWFDQTDVSVLPDAGPVGGVPAELPPARLFEMDAPLVKKSVAITVSGEHPGGRLSPFLASGWGEDAGEFADNPAWSQLVSSTRLPLMRINARLDRFTRNGVYDTTVLERDIAALKAVGTQAMVVIDATPASLGKARDNPTDVAAWAEMAAGIVKRLNVDLKLGVPVWQIWHEADSKTSWTGKAEEYGALAARAAERMKREDASIVILAGGLSRVSAVREFGPQVLGQDAGGAIDGLAWSTFAFDKLADGSANDVLERTWGFERPFLHMAQLSRDLGRPLLTATGLRHAGERTVYNPRLDSVFAPVYLASSLNHLARQNAFLGSWQNTVPQRMTGLIDGKGQPRPLVKLLGRFNALLRDRDWYWVESGSSTATIETLAAVSGDRFMLLLINKDATGGQYDATVKLEGLKLGSGTVWSLGRGGDGDEEKPLPAGALRLQLPPMSVSLISGSLAEPALDPANVTEGLQSASRTPVTVLWVDRLKGMLLAEDKDGRPLVVATGALQPVDPKGMPAGRPFLPGQRLDLTGKKKQWFFVADKCVLRDQTASVPRSSDSGFNLAERLKGRPVIVAERIKPGYDQTRLLDLPIKPAMVFTAKQLKVDSKKAATTDSDFSAKVRLAWDEENLYIIATVQDDTVITAEDPKRWDRSDAMVAGFDLGFDSSPGSNDENDSEFVAYAKDNKGQGLVVLAAGKKGGSFSDGVRYSRPGKDSHQVAMVIPWTLLGFVPEAGRSLGFNLVLSETDKEKTSEGCFEWAGGMSNVAIGAQDFSRFGILELR
jgi:hypothetical protein